jgi:exosortase/archaeosortase family protein
MHLPLLWPGVNFSHMLKTVSRLFPGIPERFILALLVAGAFSVFLTVDQIHWWQSKPDYAFGWLVPAFVVYLVFDRWPKLREMFRDTGPSPLSRGMHALVSGLAGLALVTGLLCFLAGALYRAGAGATLPGSLALAFGFAGVLPALVYFNMPEGRTGPLTHGSVWSAFRHDAQVRGAGLFVFPAFIWILSAPLVTAVENAISLMLLHKVVTVVFTVFSLLGYPLIQQGNVLVLPHGSVGVADACSGIRSLTGCLFAGSFLAAVFLDKFWKKILLVGLAMAFAFLTNLLRSLFLTGWAYAYGSDAIEGKLHDATGYAVLGLTTLGLLCLLPLFNAKNWFRWLGASPSSATAASG